MIAHSLNEPTDTVIGSPSLSNLTLLDFWRWAFSDLCDDDLKGIFAEWLVHRLLGVQSSRRISWANSDVITSGVRLEVKATSYWQSWKVLDEMGRPYAKPLYDVPADASAIRFSGLAARNAVGVADQSKSRELKSQIYVFAFQHERDISRWNAMDLSQWEFYVIRAEELAKIAGRNVALKKLRPNYGPLTASEFTKRANALIEQLAAY
jgi:hypothetical protein